MASKENYVLKRGAILRATLDNTILEPLIYNKRLIASLKLARTSWLVGACVQTIPDWFEMEVSYA